MKRRKNNVFLKIFSLFAVTMCIVITGCGSAENIKETSGSQKESQVISTGSDRMDSTMSSAGVATEKQSDTIKVTFHYLRNDGDYSDMSVWAWPYAPVNGEGASYELKDTGDGDGAVAVMEIPNTATSYGFIIRKNDWSLKDTASDRFIEIGDVISGSINVYCKTGEEDFSVEEGSDIIKGLKFLKAAAESRNEISYELTGEVNDAKAGDFTLTGPDNIKIKELKADGKKGTIIVSSEIDYLADYTLSYKGASMPVTMPDYYSSEEFEDKYTYTGDDLGVTYTKEATSFRVWAPTATKVEINLYDKGDGGKAIKQVEMTADANGTWVASVPEDLNKKYYTYTASFKDGTVNEDIVDPYARTVGVNGKRGEIIDLKETDPKGWDKDARQTKEQITDNIIYEAHIRDFSIDESNGIKNKGKYLAFTEKDTVDRSGVPSGLSHIKDLGVTAVHILPSYDYGSVDESKLDRPQYNWGYDPVNYNAPEGSYSTDPYHGEVRVNEYKQMVKSLHEEGLGAVMDVVYNHTYNTDYCFNKLVPGYFYRPDSNASGCGNDVASERSMVRKFIVDSVSYWAKEYHLDGFRFDLMGLIDTDTMNAVRKALDEIDPKIIVYGEGWSMDSKITKSVVLDDQKSAKMTPGIAFFSDTIRDGIKGSVFDAASKGYVNGPENGVLLGVKDVLHGVKYSLVWSGAPSQTMNYASCHDNLALWDKIRSSNSENSEKTNIRRDKLAAAIVMTAEGTPFMQAGDEFLRTKTKEDGTFDANSYASSDEVNKLDYSRTKTYKGVYDYYKGLIAIRKSLPALRIATAEESKERLNVIKDGGKDGIIEFEVKKGNSKDREVVVIYNPNDRVANVKLPKGKWEVLANGGKAGTDATESVSGKVKVEKISAAILVKYSK